MKEPSEQQLAIRAALAAPERRSLAVQAAAGSGKTTTGVWLCREVVPQFERSVFLAFGKDIAEELGRRLPYWVTSGTYHKIGLASIRRAIRFVKRPDEGKCRSILKQLVPTWSERREIEPDVLRAVSFAKAYGLGALDCRADAMQDILDGLGSDVDVNIAHDVLARSNALFDSEGAIDFDDMLYLPLLRNFPLDQYDNIFIDEAQDTNAVQLALTERMLFRGGRVVAVGDERQAIYAFRGADASAMRNLIRTFNMIELPLSVSYRCSREVVEEARYFLENPKPQRRWREVCGDAEWAETNEEYELN